MNPALQIYAALYQPSAEEQARALAEVGDAIQAQMAALSDDPTVERAEAMAANLLGARRAVLRLREALLRRDAAHAR